MQVALCLAVMMPRYLKEFTTHGENYLVHQEWSQETTGWYWPLQTARREALGIFLQIQRSAKRDGFSPSAFSGRLTTLTLFLHCLFFLVHPVWMLVLRFDFAVPVLGLPGGCIYSPTLRFYPPLWLSALSVSIGQLLGGKARSLPPLFFQAVSYCGEWQGSKCE